MASLKVFGRWLSGLGGQLVKRDTSVRPKWDEVIESYENAEQMSHENANWVKAKWKEVTDSFPKFQSLSVGCFVGFANLITFKFLNFVFIKGTTLGWHGHEWWLLIGMHGGVISKMQL